jgi:hypothetical protein
MHSLEEALKKADPSKIDRWILRLGKNEEEAGKFEPWHCTSKDFKEDFDGFLTCLALNKFLDSVKERMSLQKKGVREAKKQLKAIQKEVDKAADKVKKEAEKAQKKLDRTAERERIKADAKRAREEAKLAKSSADKPSQSGTDKSSEGPAEVQAVPGPLHGDSAVQPSVHQKSTFEEAPIERKPFVVPMEG